MTEAPEDALSLAQEILAERESWYDAMGDDEATAPNELQERLWNLAEAVIRQLGQPGEL